MLNKFALYEKAVQTPHRDIQWISGEFENIFGRSPVRLREDFCGTFRFAAEWVKSRDDREAICLDLDIEPLQYGRKRHFDTLSMSQKRRLKILRRDVRSATRPLADVVVAFNFSFNVFKAREDLVGYLRQCHRSMRDNSMVIFEMAGGPGMIQKGREQKSFYDKRGKRQFTYVWEQRRFNPITAEAFYAIHFKLADGRVLKDAFTYDWRLWSLSEIRDVMRDAGFEESRVYSGSDLIEVADNDWSYVVRVAALKMKKRGKAS